MINKEKTIEQQVASAVLERKVSEIKIDGKEYEISAPSLATLIMVSEIISTFPEIEKVENEKVVYSVLHNAKDFKALGELVAVLILGAKYINVEEEVVEQKKYLWGLIKRNKKVKKVIDKKAQLAKVILENLSPATLFDLIVARLNQLEITSFFAITTSLNEANILRPTKEVVR